MWKKIDILEILIDLKPGTLISQKPGDKDSCYKVITHANNHIEISKLAGKPTIKIFHQDELLPGNWYSRH